MFTTVLTFQSMISTSHLFMDQERSGALAHYVRKNLKSETRLQKLISDLVK
jgi:hypothetical protein